MGVETALIVSAIAAGAGTAATVESSAQQRRLAGQAKNVANHDAGVQKKQIEERRLQEENNKAMLAQRERQRVARGGSPTDTRGGTLLTGQTGSPAGGGQPYAATKTLLGT